MSRHSFDPEIAQKVGINAAVIYQNLSWWCEKNAANEKNIHDGKAWTHNSLRAFEILFPYLSGNQIRTALDKLETSGLIEVGNFNKKAYDRTKWYCAGSHMHLGKNPNGVGFKPEPIPVSKPVGKQEPPNPQGGDGLFSEESETKKPDPTESLIEEGFSEFWNDIWPRHERKAGKADCRKVYDQACRGKHPKTDKIAPADLNAATKRFIASVKDKQFLPGPLPWLRKPGWEPYIGDAAPKRDSYAARLLRGDAR